MENSCNLTAVWPGTAALRSRSDPGEGRRVQLEPRRVQNLQIESGASAARRRSFDGKL